LTACVKQWAANLQVCKSPRQPISPFPGSGIDLLSTTRTIN